MASRNGQLCSLVAFLLRRRALGSSYCDDKETSLFSRRTNGSAFCLRFQECFHRAFAISSVCCLLSDGAENIFETQQLAPCQPTVTSMETVWDAGSGYWFYLPQQRHLQLMQLVNKAAIKYLCPSPISGGKE